GLALFLLMGAAGAVSYAGFLGGRMVFGGRAAARSNGSHLNDPREAVESKTAGADSKLIAAGEKLFHDNDCLSCHMLSGRGGAAGPDLTHEGALHSSARWQIEHLKNPAKITPGSIMPSYSHLKADELKALAAYLISRK